MTDLPFPTDLLKFVAFLVANGATIAVLLEKLPAFQNLSARAKTIGVFVIVVIALPLLGELATWALATLPPATLATVQHYLTLALSGFYLYTATQVAHGLDPLRPKTEVAVSTVVSEPPTPTGKTTTSVVTETTAQPPDTVDLKGK